MRVIRLAVDEDLPTLQDIERAAGALFRDLDMQAVADDPPPDLETLRSFRRRGRAWVFADGDDRPVAYLLVELVDNRAHVEQVSVHPSHARNGIGRRLIDQADSWAAEHGLSELTLTTYVDVPWNGPYYQRLGFRFMRDDEMGKGLRAIREREAARGLDMWVRAAMIRERRALPGSVDRLLHC
jgi:GNAT superfamily N-acetyltransferase